MGLVCSGKGFDRGAIVLTARMGAAISLVIEPVGGKVLDRAIKPWWKIADSKRAELLESMRDAHNLVMVVHSVAVVDYERNYLQNPGEDQASCGCGAATS